VGYSSAERKHVEARTTKLITLLLCRRCFKALGFDEYFESYGDGLQILRYNVTTAYNSHMDWIEDKVSIESVFVSGWVL
jgi:hypothetical protein